MRTDFFDFDLPDGLIALRPVHPRDAARLLVVQPGEKDALADKRMVDLPLLLEPGDALVFNDTRVIPAALKGIRLRGDTTVQVSATCSDITDDCDSNIYNLAGICDRSSYMQKNCAASCGFCRLPSASQAGAGSEPVCKAVCGTPK